MQLCGSLSILCHCLSLELERKLTFSRPVATAEFCKFAGIFNAALSQHHLLGFENSSTGILSPPLALCIVMLLHLTAHSRMSGSRWVITPWWLSGSWRPFLYSSCEVMEFQLSYFKSWKMMLWKCCTQYASKFGKLSSGHRTGKGQFSSQSQRKAIPKNAQTTKQLHSSHMLVK